MYIHGKCIKRFATRGAPLVPIGMLTHCKLYSVHLSHQADFISYAQLPCTVIGARGCSHSTVMSQAVI